MYPEMKRKIIKANIPVGRNKTGSANANEKNVADFLLGEWMKQTIAATKKTKLVLYKDSDIR